MSTTKVEIQESKYGKMFTVWKVLGETSEGEIIKPEYPEVKFGIKKAKAILEHVEELKQFVKGNE